jgi:amino acid transporter
MQLMFAFFGLEVALVPSGEVRDPARTVPRAILFAIGGITLLYLAVQEAAQGILGPALAGNAAPLSAAAGMAFGHWAELMLILGAGISMLGNMSGVMLAMPRSVFALARDGYLPSLISRVHPVTRVPTNAILLFSAIITLLSATGTFTSLLVLANVSALLMYLLCCLAVLGLRYRNIRLEGAPFTIPGGIAVPVLASIAIVGLLSTVTFLEYRAIAIALLVAAILYFIPVVVRWFRGKMKGGVNSA